MGYIHIYVDGFDFRGVISLYIHSLHYFLLKNNTLLRSLHYFVVNVFPAELLWSNSPGRK
jgi:hypothetical protein